MTSHAICPGSFDPVTNGHLDIIHRAAALFDQVTVVVTENPMKRPAFSVEQRMEFIRRITKDLPNVQVDSHCGMLADYTKAHQVTAIVKGLRVVSDFEYELQQAAFNHKFDPHADTVFLTARPEYMGLSSSAVKQIAYFGGEISDLVPEEILKDVKNGLKPVK